MNRPAVLITGGAQRLGAAIARAFDAAGWRVIIHYRSSHDAANALARQLTDSDIVQADLGDLSALNSLFATLDGKEPNWLTLINNASIFEWDGAARIDMGIAERSFRLNACSPVLAAQQFLSSGQHRSGRTVINVLDQKIANPNPDFFSYSMAKSALEAATRMLAGHHGAGPHRIYGLAPGAMLPSHDQTSDEHRVSGRMNLLQRLTKPEELAEAAVFLAQGHLASGQTLFVDSGQHLLSQERDVLFLARQGNGPTQST